MDFFHPQIPDFQIAVTIYQWKVYLFSFQMMYESQFRKIDHYDLFCGHIYIYKMVIVLKKSAIYYITFTLYINQSYVFILQRIQQEIKQEISIANVFCILQF